MNAKMLLLSHMNVFARIMLRCCEGIKKKEMLIRDGVDVLTCSSLHKAHIPLIFFMLKASFLILWSHFITIFCYLEMKISF